MKKTRIMRVDEEFFNFTKKFAQRNKIAIPRATNLFQKELSSIKKKIKQEDIIF